MAAVGTEAQIARALLQWLADLTLSPPLSVAWPDKEFPGKNQDGTPKPMPQDASGKPLPYLEAALLPAPTRPVTIPHDGYNSYSGFLQVTVVYPQNSGIIEPSEVAAKIVEHFKRGTQMTDGNTTVQITVPPSVGRTYLDQPYTRTPVTVRYRVFAK